MLDKSLLKRPEYSEMFIFLDTVNGATNKSSKKNKDNKESRPSHFTKAPSRDNFTF